MVIEGRFEHNEINVKIGENYKKANKTSKFLINSLKFILKYQNFLIFSKIFLYLIIKNSHIFNKLHNLSSILSKFSPRVI